MKAVPSLGLTALLVSGGLPSTGAPSFSPSGAAAGALELAGDTTEKVQERDRVRGTVRHIDRETGVISVDTANGLVELLGTPAETAELEIGDVLAVSVTDEEDVLTGDEPRPPAFSAPPDVTSAEGEADEPPR